jgi:phage protein D
LNSAEHYVPHFEIQVGVDEPLRHGQTIDVLSVSVTDTVNQADSFTFTVRDRHPQPGHFAGGAKLVWIDSGSFDEGTEVNIRLGYVDNLAFEFEGEITAVSASFPESGLPTLAVRGFSFYHRLQRRRRRKPFKSATDSGIAEEIAKDMGWGSEVDVTDVERPLVSSDSATYDSILKSRAQRINFEVAVKKKVLHFQKPGYMESLSPQHSFEWGSSLRSFSPSLTTFGMVTHVAVRSPQTARGRGRKPLVSVAMATDRAHQQYSMGKRTGPQIALEEFQANELLHEDHDIENQKEADAVALAQLEAKALGFISGRGSCIGNPKLKARSVIELRGLGERFSGTYYVTSVTHTIDAGGYRTDFEVKRNGR